MTKLTIKNALTKVGVTDKEKQDAFLAAYEGKNPADISDQDVIDELKKLGVNDEQAQVDFFAAVREPEVLDQEIDLDELEAVSGGGCNLKDEEADQNCCVKDHTRNYQRNGCASTLQVDRIVAGIQVTKTRAKGLCSSADFCYNWAVDYPDVLGPWTPV